MEMSWIQTLLVLLRKPIQKTKGERGGQEMSWMPFLIVLLRKSIQEERGGWKCAGSSFLLYY